MVVDTVVIQAADIQAAMVGMVDKKKLSKSFVKAQEVTEVMAVMEVRSNSTLITSITKNQFSTPKSLET